MTTAIAIDLGPRSYDIVIGAGLLGTAGALVGPHMARKRAIVVTDETVAALHLPALCAGLEAAGISRTETVLPAGEATKSFESLATLCERLLAAGLARDDTVIAFGGGVVGDLAGFAASILLRGIDFIQIPTTLLAQVDSSVGGKTGINTPQGKNLVGSFHQPRLVVADTTVLDTLPRRELLAGYAETVKYGLIGDAAFFGWLEERGQAVVDSDAAAREHAVAVCCAAKARYVRDDERERGSRALLNLGHTFGHALEVEAGFGDSLLHGEAVAIGMVLAFELSVRLGLCPAADAQRVRDHLAAVGLPTAPTAVGRFDPEALLAHMGRDKKVRDGRLVLVLARGIGAAFTTAEVTSGQILDLLRTVA